MKINTKYFGSIEVNPTNQINFPKGLFGFEDHKSFFIIAFEENDDSLLCLQCKDEPYLAFILLNPFNIVSDYHPLLADEDLEDLQADASSSLAFYTIAVLHDDFRNTTINLKCPIVLNSDKKLAKQVILEGSDYSLRHPIVEKEKEE